MAWGKFNVGYDKNKVGQSKYILLDFMCNKDDYGFKAAWNEDLRMTKKDINSGLENLTEFVISAAVWTAFSPIIIYEGFRAFFGTKDKKYENERKESKSDVGTITQ